MEAARRRLDALEPRTVRTPFGTVEYVDRGEGPIILLIHGITQGADGGLRDMADDLVPPGHRLIVPSRFGYLGSEMPSGATPEMQADAFASLLDALSIEGAVVIAGSAGSTSALQLAIRHGDRVGGLVLVSANVPGPHQLKGMPPKAVFRLVFGSDPILWTMNTYAPGLMARMSQVLRIPDGVPPTPEHRRKIRRAMDGVFPGRARVTGAVFDAYVSNPAVNGIDVARVDLPTIVMHAKDDPGPPYAAAVRMAERMPDARLVTVERGGHMMLGEHPEATREVERFIGEHSGANEGVRT
jgi:pimeloyl-ACP methyl ester carboxylesterase